MSNKQRTDNLRAIPDPDKADLTPAEKGAETKKKNAEIAAKKADLADKIAQDNESRKLQKQKDETFCQLCKSNVWRARATYPTYRIWCCVGCGASSPKMPR